MLRYDIALAWPAQTQCCFGISFFSCRSGAFCGVTAHPLLITFTHSQGDNDPVDVVEIGSVQCQQGGVYKVKPLGAYAMIDDGELDWKIVCIRTDDPLADVLNDIEDVERYRVTLSFMSQPDKAFVPFRLGSCHMQEHPIYHNILTADSCMCCACTVSFCLSRVTMLAGRCQENWSV